MKDVEQDGVRIRSHLRELARIMHGISIGDGIDLEGVEEGRNYGIYLGKGNDRLTEDIREGTYESHFSCGSLRID